MRIELYAIPNCIHGEAIKIFLNKNNLPFKEIKIDNSYKEVSFLKITYNHSIHLINGFNEFLLKQMIEHIEKYKCKIER